MSGRSGLLDQLQRYGEVLDEAVVDPIATMTHDPFDLHPRRRRAWAVAMAVVVLIVITLVAVTLTRIRDEGSGPPASRHKPRGIVVARTSLRWAGPWGIASDGTDVWTAENLIVQDADGSSRPSIQAAQRSGRRAERLARYALPQESADAIASDGRGGIYVTGGGDGGVPQTTVSKIDERLGAVVFTTTLTSSCSCPIIAADAGVWMGGNGSDEALRLERQTGKVAATVDLGAPATAIGALGSRLLIGFAGARLALVSPLSNEVLRTLDLVPSGAAGAVVAITPVPGGGERAWVTLSDGRAFLVEGGAKVTSRIRFGTTVESVAILDGWLYASTGRGSVVVGRSTKGDGRVRIDVGEPPRDTASARPSSVVATKHHLWVTRADLAGTTYVIRPDRAR
jgi:hypothetical protein